MYLQYSEIIARRQVQHFHEALSRPCHPIWSANFALIIWNRYDITDSEAVV